MSIDYIPDDLSYHRIVKKVLEKRRKMKLSIELKDAINEELREDCREEAMKILELCEDKDRVNFLKAHQNDKGNILCLILDFAKKKLVEKGLMEQKESDCFEDPYKTLNNGNKKR